MTNPLMEYLPPAGSQPQQPAPQQGGALKYTGAVASGYDAKREQSPKWIAEQRIIEGFLDDLPADSWVLDAPCGTGRFFDFYARKGFVVRGLDISADMLAIAGRKVQDPTSFISHEKGPIARWALFHGDMLASKIPDKSVDATVSCRVTRWIIQQHGPEGIRRMLQEMQRIARQRVIFTARVRNHPFAVSHDLIMSALQGWTVARDQAGYHEDYRIVELRPEVA
jgi:ubiquinone/menaquinone biosynthesis C-methylase UbiE